MNATQKNKAFHGRLAMLIGTQDPFRWAKEIGIPSATFSRIWTGNSIPKHDHLCRIADKCNVSLDWLLRGRDEDFNRHALALVPVVEFASCGVRQGWYNESPLDYAIVFPDFCQDKSAFAVISQGLSMAPLGIKPGSVCLVYPNRPIVAGKPVLIKTKDIVDGKEVCLSSIKRFDGEAKESYKLTGFLDPDASGEQSVFFENRKKSIVTMIASIGNILDHTDMNLLLKRREGSAILNENVLKKCFESLKPQFMAMESKHFMEMVMFVYKQALKTGEIDQDTVNRFKRLFAKKQDFSVTIEKNEFFLKKTIDGGV